MTICKLCKSEDVSDYVDAEEISYKENVLQVLMAYSLCNNCDREFISKPQILQNEAALRAAKKDHDGLLSSEEIIRAGIRMLVYSTVWANGDNGDNGAG